MCLRLDYIVIGDDAMPREGCEFHRIPDAYIVIIRSRTPRNPHPTVSLLFFRRIAVPLGTPDQGRKEKTLGWLAGSRNAGEAAGPDALRRGVHSFTRS